MINIMKKIKCIALLLLIVTLVFTGCGYKEVLDNHEVVDMNSEINDYFTNSDFSGAVLIARNQKIIYCHGFGKENEKGISITSESRFEIGSLTKQMTASIILNLCDKGYVELDDTIDKYFEELSFGKRVTIRQLINMTSGIPEYMEDEDIMSKDPMDVIAESKIDENLYNNYDYSNSNYYLLGKIIEKVTGKTYEEMLKEYVFNKVGMQHSKLGVSNIVPVYMYSDEASYPIEYTYSAGGVCSTVYDLYDWERAYWNGEIIPQQYMEELKENKSGYLNGWSCSDGIYTHSGSTKSFSSYVYMDMRNGAEIIILSNDLRIDCENVVRDLLKLVKQN